MGLQAAGRIQTSCSRVVGRSWLRSRTGPRRMTRRRKAPRSSETNTVRRLPRRVSVLTMTLLGIGAVVLSSCDWPQFRYGPEGTGFNPFESTINTSNVSGLQQRWCEPNTGSSPVVANGVAYVTSGGALEAFDANSGTGKWSSPLSLSYTPVAPAVSQGKVYANSYGTFGAFDAGTGAAVWSNRSGEGYSAPLVANGVVYSTDFNVLRAFDAGTGSLIWSYSGISPGLELGYGVAVANGVLYDTDSVGDVGANDVGNLLAFNAATGASLWTSPIGHVLADGSPAVANGIVFITTYSDTLDALDATTGALLWSVVLSSAPSNTFAFTGSSPAVANGVVYVSTNNGQLNAFNTTTGAALWSASTGATNGASQPVVANGVVYVGGNDGKLHAFDAASGSQLFTADHTGQPVVANGVVYVGSGSLCAFSLSVSSAELTVSPTFAPDYGTLIDGTSSAPTTFTVTNFGSTPTTGISDSLVGADPLQFRVTSDTCAGAVLTGGASCTIGVAFAPTLPGGFTASLAVNAATGGSTSATLSGTANPLTMTPTAFDYGTVLDSTHSAPATFTVTNHSSTTVSPSVASLAGSQFTVSHDTCTGATLAAGATCSIVVVFTPTGGFGSTSASLSVSSTPGGAAGASLSGTAEPWVTFPSTKDYGTVPVGSSSAATFVMVNLSSASLVQYAQVSGSGFSLTSDSCSGVTLAPNASCTMVVTFAPSAKGAFQGQLSATGYFFSINQATLTGTGG